jgi:uncharacterized membrane protein YfcA
MRAFAMREIRLTLPELALIAGTRGMLGAGVGLLLADRLPESQRKAVGWTLLAVGALTTIPIAFEVFGSRRASASFPAPRSSARGAQASPSSTG